MSDNLRIVVFLFLAIFFKPFCLIGEVVHSPEVNDAKQIAPTTNRPANDKTSELKPEIRDALNKQLKEWNQASSDGVTDPAIIAQFLEQLVGDFQADQQKEILQAIIEHYPESSINNPLIGVIQSKLKPTNKLIHHLGTSETGDVPTILKSDRQELTSRIEKQLQLSPGEAQKLSEMVFYGGALEGLRDSNGRVVSQKVEEKLRRGLSGAFSTSEEIESLAKKLSRATPEDPFLNELKGKLEGGIELIKQKGRETAPQVSPGNSVAEPRSGTFLVPPGSLSTVPLTIPDNGGKLYPIGPQYRDIEEAADSSVFTGTPIAPSSPWVTDYRGIPATTLDNKKVLVDPKYHGGGQADKFPVKESEVTGREVKDFPYYFEGGNIITVPKTTQSGPGKGRPLVITSSALMSENAAKTGDFPATVQKAFDTTFAADGRPRLVLDMPRNGTQHVDMDIAVPDYNRPKVFVSTYRENHIETLSTDDQKHARASLSLLDDTARRLKPYVEVERVPQLPPINGVHYPKLNALYFPNQKGEPTAIVPDYPNYPHLGVNTEINRANEDSLRRAGYPNVIFAKCYSAESHGAFHCMYPQVDY